MSTPVGFSHRDISGPSPHDMQQLWDKLRNTSAGAVVDNEDSFRGPASTRSWFSRRHSASVWVGGSSIAQDARNQLRAADEARGQRVTANTIDGSSDWSEPVLHMGASGFQIQDAIFDECAGQHNSRPHHLFESIGYPHDRMQYMLEDSSPTRTVELSPDTQRTVSVSSQLPAAALADIASAPLSSFELNDLFLDDSSSMSTQTEEPLSPTEVPTSAGTDHPTEASQPPTEDSTRKRTFLWDPQVQVATQKRRQMTVPNIRTAEYSNMAGDGSQRFIGGDGNNRVLLRTETFVERAPTQRDSQVSTNNALPELSSFRPTDTRSQDCSGLDRASQRLARVLTAPVEIARPAAAEEPAWMRPMHLVDTGGRSIYMNAHDDGPIRHALCLWCFRTRGGFRKVHRHGYESCGRTEVLDSHYWEDDTWPDSSDNCSSSDC